MLNIECPIARQSSITFFLIHPVQLMILPEQTKWLKAKCAQSHSTTKEIKYTYICILRGYMQNERIWPHSPQSDKRFSQRTFQ